LAYPILNDGGQIEGVVFLGLDLEWLSTVSAEINLPAGSTVTLLDPQGTVLVRYPEPEQWLGKIITEGPIVQTVLALQGEGTAEDAGMDGVLRLYGFAPLRNGEQTWGYILIGIPSAVAYAGVNRMLRTNLIRMGRLRDLPCPPPGGQGEDRGGVADLPPFTPPGRSGMGAIA
jgi:hypothetical protein